MILFSFIPILQAFQLSFYDAPLLSAQRTFVGLENYATALSDPGPGRSGQITRTEVSTRGGFGAFGRAARAVG